MVTQVHVKTQKQATKTVVDLLAEASGLSKTKVKDAVNKGGFCLFPYLVRSQLDRPIFWPAMNLQANPSLSLGYRDSIFGDLDLHLHFG